MSGERRARGRPRLMSVEQRRGIVLDAAVARFGSDGFERVSVEDVAVTAGVSKPSVYELFPSKDALHDAAVCHEIDRLAARVASAYEQPADASVRQRTHARVAAVFSYAREHPEGLRLLLAAARGGRSAALRARMDGVRRAMAAQLADVLRADWSRDGVGASRSADALARMAVEATLTAAEVLLSEPDADPDAGVALVTAFLVRGFSGVDAELLAAADGGRVQLGAAG